MPFIDKGYVKEEKIKSLKNDTDTSLYRLTGQGLIHLYEIKSLAKDYKSSSNDLELRESILNYVQTTLNDSVRDNFYLILFRRLHEINSPFFSNLSNSYMSTELSNRLTSLMFFPFFPNSSEILEVNYESIEDKQLK